MGLVPLAWVLSLHAARRRLDPHWLWLALAFGVSWIADWLSHLVPAPFVGPAYVTGQSSLIAWTLLPSSCAARFIVVLLGALACAMLTFDPSHPDILVHTIGWLGLVLLLWRVPLIQPLRWMVTVAFGLGLLAWWIYIVRPGWPTWLTYQGIRASGIGLFCWASWAPYPFRLVAA